MAGKKSAKGSNSGTSKTAILSSGAKANIKKVKMIRVGEYVDVPGKLNPNGTPKQKLRWRMEPDES